MELLAQEFFLVLTEGIPELIDLNYFPFISQINYIK